MEATGIHCSVDFTLGEAEPNPLSRMDTDWSIQDLFTDQDYTKDDDVIVWDDTPAPEEDQEGKQPAQADTSIRDKIDAVLPSIEQDEDVVVIADKRYMEFPPLPKEPYPGNPFASSSGVKASDLGKQTSGNIEQSVTPELHPEQHSRESTPESTSQPDEHELDAHEGEEVYHEGDHSQRGISRSSSSTSTSASRELTPCSSIPDEQLEKYRDRGSSPLSIAIPTGTQERTVNIFNTTNISISHSEGFSLTFPGLQKSQQGISSSPQDRGVSSRVSAVPPTPKRSEFDDSVDDHYGPESPTLTKKTKRRS